MICSLYLRRRFEDTDSIYAPSLPASPSTPHTPINTSSTYCARPRDSLRWLPSSKPVPSSTLPPVPRSAPVRVKSHRQLSVDVPMTPVSPALPSSPSISVHTCTNSHRTPHSAPSVMSPTSSTFLPSPGSSSYATSSFAGYQFPMPPSNRRIQRMSNASSFTRGSMSITSHQRRANRSVALACLEGRSTSPHRISRLKTNFMSMSDDEDEADDEREEGQEDEEENEIILDEFEETPARRDSIQLHDAMLIDDEDVVIPCSPPVSTFKPTSPSRPLPIRRNKSHSFSLKIFVPSSPGLLSITGVQVSSSPRSITTPRSKGRRSRSTTLESWFSPLANFRLRLRLT